MVDRTPREQRRVARLGVVASDRLRSRRSTPAEVVAFKGRAAGRGGDGAA
jgi:hypothetical protein